MLLCCLAIIFIFPYAFDRAMFTLLLTLYMLTNSYAELYQSLFFQVDRIELCGRSIFFRTLLSVLAFAAVLYAFGDVIAALTAANILNIVALLVFAVIPARQFTDRADSGFDLNDCRKLLTSCIPICIIMFSMIFMVNSAKYVIDFRGSEIMQGYFNIIFIPAQVINLLSGFVFKPILIKYSKHIENKEKTLFYRLFIKQTAFILGLTIVCAALSGLLGPELLGFVFAADLVGFRGAIVLIIAGGGVFAMSALLYYILLVLRVQKLILCCYLMCSAVSLVISFILIGEYGINGAAMSFLLSYLLLSILLFAVLLRSLKRKGELS